MSKPKYKALILGSTGLIGSHLLDELIKDENYSELYVFVREKTKRKPSKKYHEILVDLDQIEKYQKYFKVDHIYCCLGTTMSKAKSKEAFRQVDYFYPLKAAELGIKYKAKKYLLVSAIGANKNSRIFYNKVKGEIEEEIKNLHYSSCVFLQPSLLLGDRIDKRLGEKIGQLIFSKIPIFITRSLKKYKPIEAKVVAKAMIYFALKDDKGIITVTSDKIQETSDGK